MESCRFPFFVFGKFPTCSLKIKDEEIRQTVSFTEHVLPNRYLTEHKITHFLYVSIILLFWISLYSFIGLSYARIAVSSLVLCNIRNKIYYLIGL